MENKTSFWNLINTNVIEIPIIQRDYAQGRLGKEYLRKTFLTDLKKALDGDYQELKLDFVYGSIEQEKLYPLDGQQRLTTLWLLHWYIALRAEQLTEESSKVFRKFTYETRISSREFCQELCNPDHFKGFDGTGIVDFIENQTWFYSSWKQDPTIQSMLRMLGGTKITNKKGEDILDGIEELFNNTDQSTFVEYWKKLIGTNCPIVFYHMQLKDFGLSDDLYIKMNARGKQLTSFENFKADLIRYILGQSENELIPEKERNDWNKLLDPKNGLPISLDTKWTDLFWEYRSVGITNPNGTKKRENQIDEIYFAFLNRFFWNELFIAKNNENYILDIGKGDENSTKENENESYKFLNDSDNKDRDDTKIVYEDFSKYKYFEGNIPLDFFKKLKKVLDNIHMYIEKHNVIPTCKWDKFDFIPQYYVDEKDCNEEISNNSGDQILKVTSITQIHRIVFFALCKYFDHDENISDDFESLKRWMRVVWNLVSGDAPDGKRQIRSTKAIRNAIEYIDRLDSHNVYQSLSNEIKIEKTSDFESRYNEEIEKAKQILNGQPRNDNKNWEDVIKDAEEFAFFKGAIRFLFINDKKEPNWLEFDKKYENAKKYFDINGVKDSTEKKYNTEAILLKTVLYHIEDFSNYIENEKQIFDNEAGTWESNILLEDGWEKAVHKIMVGDFNIIPRDSDCLIYQTLYNSNLLNYIAKNLIKARIRWIHHHRAIYPRNKSGIMLDDDLRDIKFYRNKILSSDTRFKSSQKIDGYDYYIGWDIYFEYGNHEFQWNTDEKVYLIEDGKRNDLFYVDVKDITTANELIEKLDSLFNNVNNSNIDKSL